MEEAQSMRPYVEHVGDGLEAPVRVVGESGGLGDGELVEQEERVQVPELVPAAAAASRISNDMDGSTIRIPGSYHN